MTRVEPDALRDPEQVYVTGSLGEARKVEALLSDQGVHYATEVEVLGSMSLFGSVRHGVGFYVTAAQAEYCRGALTQGGYSRGLVPAPGSTAE
jgi:hypothetical protein